MDERGWVEHAWSPSQGPCVYRTGGAARPADARDRVWAEHHHFAMRCAHHMCITPDAREADRIRQYCGDHGIDTSLLTFHHQPSERVLPKLDLEPLDLVLIDGSHSFPRSSKIGSSLNTRCVSAVRSSSTMCTFGPAVSCEISCALSRNGISLNDGPDGPSLSARRPTTTTARIGTSRRTSGAALVPRRSGARMAAGLLRARDVKEFARRTRALVRPRNV